MFPFFVPGFYFPVRAPAFNKNDVGRCVPGQLQHILPLFLLAAIMPRVRHHFA
jgi:hypothetical protein